MLRPEIELDELRACVVGLGLMGTSERRSAPVDEAELPDRLREAATDVGGGTFHGELVNADVVRSGVAGGVPDVQRSNTSFGESGRGAETGPMFRQSSWSNDCVLSASLSGVGIGRLEMEEPRRRIGWPGTDCDMES